jgi:hypothetical protein
MRVVHARPPRVVSYLNMDNLKPFDPADIDETLTRVVRHGGHIHLLFPYINGVNAVPHFASLSITIAGPAASVEDLAKLTALVNKSRNDGEWVISFSTPWLVRAEEVQDLRARGSLRKRR